MNKFDRFDHTRELLGIVKYHDYMGEPIWKSPTYSTYYDYNVDTQCCVPGQNAKEILSELGLTP